MMKKRRIWWIAVSLGVLLGAGMALMREGENKKAEVKRPEVSSPVATNSMAPVVAQIVTNAVTNAVKSVAVTNAVAIVQSPPTPNPQPPKLSKPITTYVAHVPKARQVLLANRRIVIEKGRSFPKQFCETQMPTTRGTAPYIVLSELPVNREVRIRATADGAKVIGFLPSNALLVEADAAALKNLEEDVMFMAAVEYEPSDKIQQALGEAMQGEVAKVEASVVLLNEQDRETMSAFITANGGTMIEGTPAKGKSITAEIPASLITDLAKKAEVKWIEKHERLKLLNDQAVLPQVMNVTPVWNTHGLTGEGQIIATLDSGIDTGDTSTLNADFENKIVEIYDGGGFTTADYGGHGTHTAGSLVGTGANSSGQFKGVAHDAQLFVMACGDTAGSEEIHLNNFYSYADVFSYKIKKYGYGVKSDSWGAGGSDDYDMLCVELDDCIWNHPELLEVFAAGNDGYNVAGTIDSPASAKNVLAVGATGNRRFYTKDQPNDDNIYTMSSYTSLGPTSDGRTKPDICAPGEYVVSVLSANASSGSKFAANPNYQYMSGTSMATPLTAGCAALVREWLMKHRGYSETKPTAALMKAILTGGAFDICEKSSYYWQYGAVPSNYQGWGRVDLEASIFPTNGLAVYLKDRLPFKAGEEFAFTVVTTNAASLRAQLVWIDHAAEQESGPMINNNLDLTVSNADIGTLYGNGGTAADEINTVESVRIENAAAGRYIVKVTCPTVPYDYTEGGAAAIYIRGAFDPADVIEGEVTEAQLAAQKSPSTPVYLLDAGADSSIVTKDGWIVADINNVPSFSITTNNITFKHDNDGGNFWRNTTSATFSVGEYVDIYGRAWSSVEEEMLVSLGLKGTKESNLTAFMKTGFNMGAGTGEKTVNITGLSQDKRYVLHYMACDGEHGKSGKFQLRSGYSGTPTIHYVKGTTTSFAPASITTAITASANEPLLVRVTNLRPNNDGKIVIDVGGATVNVLAIAELPPAPYIYYLCGFNPIY